MSITGLSHLFSSLYTSLKLGEEPNTMYMNMAQL